MYLKNVSVIQINLCLNVGANLEPLEVRYSECQVQEAG